jgi:hypothetical protein
MELSVNQISPTSTIMYDNLPKIVPLRVTDSLWIGSIGSVYDLSPANVLNLTSTYLASSGNTCVYNVPMSSNNFEMFIKTSQMCIKFIDQYKGNDSGSPSKSIAFICCRNGYSRCLVALALYKITQQTQTIDDIICEMMSFKLHISSDYIKYLRTFNQIINGSLFKLPVQSRQNSKNSHHHTQTHMNSQKKQHKSVKYDFIPNLGSTSVETENEYGYVDEYIDMNINTDLSSDTDISNVAYIDSCSSHSDASPNVLMNCVTETLNLQSIRANDDCILNIPQSIQLEI